VKLTVILAYLKPGVRYPDGEDALPNQQIDDDTTRATACLPGLEIEIVHRRSPAADAERISINLQAVRSLEAFGRFLQTANPFAFWAQAAQMAWFPWLGAASVLMLPWSVASAPPKLSPGNTESGLQERSHA
jgi:hypothetical protein